MIFIGLNSKLIFIKFQLSRKEGQCKFQTNLGVVNITSWAILPARDERALQAAVATIGPIAVSINASPRTFQLYQLVFFIFFIIIIDFFVQFYSSI